MKFPLLALLASLAASPALLRAAPELSFSRDIRPLLSDSCFKCHGPDDQGRKGQLRLDDRDAALRGGKSGQPAIHPGHPETSEIIRRLRSQDPDDMMPPPELKKSLSPAQRDLFEQWIARGATYEKHWAFTPPTLPAVPAPANPAWPQRNEIDAFVQAQLPSQGFSPAPEADPPTLLRRLSLDLTGLIPTPAELDAFLADPSPQAYERAVDRLLASPQYGEKWARKWLDLARYSDTNGYEKDRDRTMWPYRDWVIQSLNADLPFDQFTIDQIAGDLLPNPTLAQQIATGFHRNTMLNEEGGIDPLEYRYRAMVDRVGVTSATWLGLTLQCAQCHTHKYDPITHQEYFSMFAFLNNADEPDLAIPSPSRPQEEAERLRKLAQHLAALPSQWPANAAALDAIAWETPVPTPLESAPAETPRLLPDHSLLFPAPGPDQVTTRIRLSGLSGPITHLRLEALPDPSLPATGPGRTPHGNFVLSEIKLSANGQALALTQASANAAQPGFPAASAIDGQSTNGWAVDDKKSDLHAPKFALFTLEKPWPGGADLDVTLEQVHGTHHTIGRLRLSVGSLPPSPPAPGALAAATEAWLAEQRRHTAAWIPTAPAAATSNLPLLTVQPDASILVSGDITKADTYQLRFTNVPPGTTALRLEALPDDSLPARGPGLAYYEGPKGDFFLGECQLSQAGHPLKFSQATHSYAKNAFGSDANSALAIDGNPETGWSCAQGQGRAHEAVFVLEKPLPPDQGDLSLTLMFGRHFACSLGKFRISFTSQSGDIRASTLPADRQPLLAKANPSPAEQLLLQEEFLLHAPELAAARQEIDQLRQPPPSLTTLVFRERPAQNPRPTFIHNRGEFTQPGAAVSPAVLSVLNPLPPGAPPNRLSFARWLVSRDQPLTARVVANRAWAAFFGRGLVKTQEDFGYQGELPSHPLLLDWLAVRFMDDGWSQKQLHRRLVLSHTYRQASADLPAPASADPENKFLWRGPRLRIDAEEVRDSALRAASLLSDRLLGPSVFPPQPPSVTTEGTYGARSWTTSSGPDRYRRSLYTFAKRTAPFAFASTFDAPVGDACIVRRDRTNTPLQALSLLNDVTIIEASQALGRLLSLLPGSPAQQLDAAYRRCFSRSPEPAESTQLLAFLDQQRAAFTHSPESARALVGDQASPDLAAWTALARALFNLDEFITKG